MAYLEIETRDGTRRVALERERLSIGRLSYNDVVLPFAQISRQHAELRRINGQWWIADLQSTNGLQLNSHRIQEHALDDGDRILMAPGISLVFVADGAAESPLPRHSTSPSPASSAFPSPLPPPSSPVPSRSPFPSPREDGRDESARLSPAVHERGPRPLDPWAQSPGMPHVPGGGAAPFEPGAPAFGGNSHVGSAILGSPHPGERSGYDPYRRESSAYERTYATAGPAGTLLHVCQTCGQLTSPDAVYCQSCHNSIAHECAKCYLSLLPIQDRCPRCHTPNRMSVRRAHPGRGV